MFDVDIKKLTKENTYFRKVLHTGLHSQIVVMSIPVGGDIGQETHLSTDQMLFFVEGSGEAIVGGQIRPVFENDAVFVPGGVEHNFKNIGKKELKLFTVYSPPEHKDGTIYKTKEEAEKEERKEEV